MSRPTPSVQLRSPPLGGMVGRESERQMLAEHLRSAAGGLGGITLISGEAGIGKSTLVEDLMRTALLGEAIVLCGHGYVQSTALPYGPWVDAFANAPRQPELPQPPEELEYSTASPQVPDQRALFLHARDYLDALSAKRVLVLVIEDLHWADEASRELLRFVARTVASRRQVIVVTIRDDELARGHPLHELIPSLVRESQALRLPLHPLDGFALQQLTAAHIELEGSEQARLVTFVADRSEGNPLYVTELLRAIKENVTFYGLALADPERVQVPTLVRQLVELRIARLGSDVRTVLEAAATVGRDVPLDLLGALVAGQEAGIEQVIEYGFLIEQHDHRSLRFSHDLVRQAIYEGIPLTRRQALHRRLGEELAARPSPNPELVAHHLFEAGDRAALLWLVQAGERALTLYAPLLAVEHLTKAIELADQLALDAPPDAFRLRAGALAATGRFDAAQADCEAALRLARTTNDRDVEWRTLIDLGALWSERDYLAAGEYYGLALALARAIDRQETIARSLSYLGSFRMNINDQEASEESFQQALAIFRELNDLRGIAETVDYLAMARLVDSRVQESVVYARQAIPIFRALGDKRRLASSMTTLAAAFHLGWSEPNAPAEMTVDEGLQAGRLAIQHSRDAKWRTTEALAISKHAIALQILGRYDEAWTLAHEALDVALKTEHLLWMAAAWWGLGSLHLELLNAADAKACFSKLLDAARQISSQVWINYEIAELARAFVEERNVGAAEALLTPALVPTFSVTLSGHRRLWYAEANRLLAAGDPEQARGLVDRLYQSAPGSTRDTVIPLLSLLRSDALLSLGDLPAAETELHYTRRVVVDAGLRPLLWRLDVLVGRLHELRGQETDATAACASAWDTILALAQACPDPKARKIFLQQAGHKLPAWFRVSRTSRTRHGAGADDLTAREREVVALVADGLTDPQIAERLSVSRRTVNAHLRSIYGKLDVSTRTAAARVALERGLV